jgi:hypothetical protein
VIEGQEHAELPLSFDTVRAINTRLDKLVETSLPPFETKSIIVDAKRLTLYVRGTLACMKILFSRKSRAKVLLLMPERHYVDASNTIRMYHKLNTDKRWWITQELIQACYPGATVVPILMASNKTQFTQYGNVSTHPVYVTSGNIPKELRKKPSTGAQILVAYLPTDSLLNIEEGRKCTVARFSTFQFCMGLILRPLVTAGTEGEHWVTGDGRVRRCHPVLAGVVCDSPEELALAGRPRLY